MMALEFATDEDIALRALADFAILCPADQVVSAGTEGAFAPADRWTLTASQVDFQATGVRAGQIVQLLKPIATFRPQGTSMVVSAVDPGGITLRRKGQTEGQGQPPSPEDGLSGVEFLVTTLAPQIEQASTALALRFGIDPEIEGRRPEDLQDLEPLREATVLLVLQRLYPALGLDNRFSARARSILSEFERLMDGFKLRWKSPNGGPGTTTARFGTRVLR